MKFTLNNADYSRTAVDAALLVLRVGFGITMLPNGLNKVTGFAEKKNDFINFLGVGPSISLSLAIFAELGCSVLLIVGLFTRLATVPLIITALVIVFMAQHGDIFGDGAAGFSYLLVYIAILLAGPGWYSIDALINPQRRRFM